MNDYTVYRQRLQSIPGSGHMRKHADGTFSAFEEFRIVLEPVGLVQAWNAETALQKAKRKGYQAPIVGPWTAKENPK